MTNYKTLEAVTLLDGTSYAVDQEFQAEATIELSELVEAGKLAVVEDSVAPAGESEAPSEETPAAE